MSDSLLPDWLKQYLDETGLEQGNFSFNDTGTLTNLPKGFVGIATDEAGGLAVTETADGIIYRWRDGEMSVFACDKDEYIVALARETIWETLSENMPALHSYWLGIEFKTITHAGKELTLGFAGTARPSALVIRGRVEVGELLADALDRELTDLLGIEEYEVLDVLDDGGTMELEGVEEPLFTAVIKVEQFDAGQRLPDVAVDWIDLNTSLVN